MADDRADEIMRHFDVVAERLETQIQQVAEGVVVLGEKVDRSTAELRRELGEVKAAITFSYTELDRRIRTLEDDVVSLADRVDRLEARKA
ncbi:MAG: hypothetical protein MUO25_09355 [Thermoanaerobaculaceae bacterium]|nr:hypothetical protein [Thermoanaerobaculaceae bacterium]